MRYLFAVLLFVLPSFVWGAQLDDQNLAECTVKPLDHWSVSEKWAWNSICLNGFADLRWATDEEGKWIGEHKAGCDALPKGSRFSAWPDSRKISAGFLKTILTDEQFKEARTEPAIHLLCSEVIGKIKLSGLKGLPSFWLDKSRIHGGVELNDSVFLGSVSFSESLVHQGIWSSGSNFSGDLFLRDSVLPTVEFVKTNISGGIDLSRSDFRGPVSFQRAIVSGELRVNSAQFRGDLSLLGSHVGGDLIFVDAEFDSLLNLERISISGNLVFASSIMRSEVWLSGASIDGQLKVSSSYFSKFFDCESVFVRRDVLLFEESSIFADASFRRSKIGGNFEVHAANFDGLDLTRSEIDGALLFLKDTTFLGELSLVGARVRKSVELYGAVMYGLADCSSLSVGDRLALSLGDEYPRWLGESKLVLKNATVGSLEAIIPNVKGQVMGHSWPQPNGEKNFHVDLRNFRYHRLSGYREANATSVAVDPQDYIAWLERSIPINGKQTDAYEPQPYMHLAITLREMGAEQAADQVDYARFKHRMEMRSETWRYLLDYLSMWFVGFGVYPWRALGWFTGLVVAGLALTLASSAFERKGVAFRLFYSIENSLPLIDLSGSFDDVKIKEEWVSNLFHFQKVAGFVLATVLVGALTLLGG